MIKAIVCCDMMGNIGKDNNLLFHIPQDMKFFKQQTVGKCVLMGYNTYLSLGSKPLPNRKNIVLADRYKKIEPHENLIVTEDMNGTIGECIGNGEEIWVIGGAYVYNTTISMEMVNEGTAPPVQNRRCTAQSSRKARRRYSGWCCGWRS